MERDLDYLDAAPPPAPEPQEDEHAVDATEIPTLEELLGEVGEDHPERDTFSLESTPPPEAPPAPSASAPRNALADAFSALLAAEQEGAPSTAPLAPPPAPVDVEAITNEVTERVLARLRAETGDLKDLVSRVASDVAERLVREEIGRIRSGRK
jgi:hypothetical protein